MSLLYKVIDGSICCALEKEEGVGCLRACPYSKNYERTATCQDELANDLALLKELLHIGIKEVEDGKQ